MFFTTLSSILVLPSVSKLKMLLADNTPCASTIILYLPEGLAMTNKFELESSIPIWWYPLDQSNVAKYLEELLICLSNWSEISLYIYKWP